jgi:Taurine catabolism dioxygenase TauD, TfdA family
VSNGAATPIFREVIRHPSAWTNASLNGKQGITYRLTERHLVAFEELLHHTRYLEPQEVTRRDFDHPVVNELLEELRDELMNGRGAVLISGITPDRFSEDEFERIYFGAGTHWGHAAVQSVAGDRLGHVRNEKDNPKNRAYLSARELKMHSDAYELIGLMCVEKAATGGYSRLASALAIHNEILLNRPDLLEPLYRGFPYATAEANASKSPVTPYNVPIFSCVQDKVSCMHVRVYIRAAAEKMSVPVPADLDEALDYFAAIGERDDIRLHFMLEPGEILMCHNFTTLHSRTSFEDSEQQRRHLLRLWLRVPNGRPVVPALLERGAAYDRLYQDAQRPSADTKVLELTRA